MLTGWNELKYKAVIFDVDGTLYDQRRLHLYMAVALGTYCLLHPTKLREIRILSAFRSWREKHGMEVKDSGKNGFEAGQYEAVAASLNVSPEIVKKVVKKWMYRAPLRFLPRCRDKRLAEFIAGLHEKGVVTVAYSDYPVEDKLSALGIRMDFRFCAADPEIACLKPDPRGIQSVLRRAGLSADECLYIGDRDEKDGASARSAGIDYLILPKSVRRRKARGLFQNIRRPSAEGSAAPTGRQSPLS